MVEHKSIPEIDSDIFAECQSLLINYDKIIDKEFGHKYVLRESLSFALQLYPSSKSLNTAVISNPNVQPIVDFIKKYRSSISAEIQNSGEYSFKAFLIQVANHETANTLPIQFVAYDRLTDVEKTNVNRVAALVKHKHINVSNKDLLKPGTIVKRVQAGLGNLMIARNGREKNKFGMDAHTRCWKKYKARPERESETPAITKSQYCVYDQPNRAYLYTNKWVDFLIEEMQIVEKYEALYE